MKQKAIKVFLSKNAIVLIIELKVDLEIVIIPYSHNVDSNRL